MSKTKIKSKKQKGAKVRRLHKKAVNSYLGQRWKDWGLIAAIALLCYFPLFQNDFVGFDDPALITNNPIVSGDDWSGVFTWGLYSAYYKPLVFLSWKIEKMLFGFNPVAFHFDNLLLHLFNCLLLYLIVGRLCATWDFTKQHRYAISFWVSLLFALHPMHVESVAWAVERKDVMFTAFFLMGWYSYLRYTKKTEWKWMAATALAYLCSMLCKAPGITLIGILFCYDLLSKRPISVRLLTEKFPVFLICGIALYFYGVFYKFGNYTQGLSGTVASEGAIASPQQVAVQASIFGQMLWVNFKMLFWFFHNLLPVKLSLGYPREAFVEFAQQLRFILPFISMGIAYFLWRSWSSNRLLTFCAAFFLITLFPALALNDYGIGIFLSDRYTYLPSLGILLFLVIGIHYLGQHWFKSIQQFSSIALIVIAGCYGISSMSNVKVWKNSETLWTNTIQKYPTVAYAYANRSKYYLDAGQTQRAIQDLNQALQLNPRDDASLVERARANRQLKQSDLALKDLNQAIQINPKNLTARLNRGNLHFDKQQINASLQDFDFVLQEDPQHLSALTNRSSVYGRLGRSDEAIRDLNTVIRIQPQSSEAYNNLVFIYYDRGEFELAKQNCQKYLQMKPEDHEIHHVNGVIQQNLGQQQQAIQAFSRAIQLKGNVANYYRSRAMAYRATGQEALAQADEAKAQRMQ